MKALVCLTAVLLVGVCSPALPDDSAPAPAPSATPAPPTPTHEQILDGLYKRLATAASPQASASIVGFIDEERNRSGSDTANLLLARAMAAAGQDHEAIGLQILDQIVALRPEWPVGWSKRGALRLNGGDVDGAMRDFAESLQRDPRDLEALAGVAAVLMEEKKLDQAQIVYQKALALAPNYAPLVEGERRLKAAIDAHTL
jgi:tetratricopeptide (TPR) repeat protein